MLKPYVFHIIGAKKNIGKTVVGVAILKKLVNKGLKVGVVKHSTHGVVFIDKDAEKYLYTGASKSFISSKDIACLYISQWIDDIEKSLSFFDEPIIIVEGFKEYTKDRDVVIVAKDHEDLQLIDRYPRERILGIVLMEDSLRNLIDTESYRVYRYVEIDKLVDMVLEKAKRYILNQLPQKNCGLCGFSNCLSLVEAYLKGFNVVCPHILNVVLKVNSKSIPLNPFVKNLLKSLTLSITSILKNVPTPIKRIELYVEF